MKVKLSELKRIIRTEVRRLSGGTELMSYGTFARLARQMSLSPFQERALSVLERLDDDDHGRTVAEWCQLLNDESSHELQRSIENIRAVHDSDRKRLTR